MVKTATPLVALPADMMAQERLAFHKAGDKYLRPLVEISHTLPVIVPALAGIADIGALAGHLDGVVVTGALSNVHPGRYGGAASAASEPYDPARDATSLALIAMALARGIPLFAICRGMQEVNVALGGTLLSEVQTHAGRLDHRAPVDDDPAVRYAERHEIAIRQGGRLGRIVGERAIMVNSLHRQAIDRLAPGLDIEAEAGDGTIEAVSVRDAKSFALAVQWHPEYNAAANPVSVKLFEAFGAAAHDHAARRVA